MIFNGFLQSDDALYLLYKTCTIKRSPTVDDNAMEYLNIGRVAEITGILPVTLRAWERRYGLPKPRRTASGHRLYSTDEVTLVQRVSALIANGASVSRAMAKIQQDGQLCTQPDNVIPNRWDKFRIHFIEGINHFDTSMIEAIYSEALSLFPIDLVIDEIMLPVLYQLGEEWTLREDGIAREHFFSAFLRNKIGTRFSHEINRTHGPSLILACLPGESHEMGLMLFGLTASARNHRILYFGADLPLNQLMPVARQVRPAALVLSGTSAELNTDLAQGLRQLAQDFSGPVYLGGELSDLHHDELKHLGIIPVGKDFRQGAEKIIKSKA